jgi:MFS family permease
MRHPVFMRIWLTGTAAYLARFMDFTLVAWLVVQRTDDAAAVGALIFLRFISFFLFGPFVGLIADRFPRIRTLRFTQAGVATTSLILGLLLLFGDVQLWQIYIYTFVNGALFMVEISVRRPYISAVVGPKNLTAALALDMISLNVAWFIGANAGGALVAIVPSGYLYTGIACTYAFNVFLLRDLPILFRREMAAGREPALKSLKSGFNYARKNRLILGGLLVVGLNNFSGYTFESMGAVFAADVFNAGPVMFGLLMSAQGLGSLVMAVIVVKYGKRVKRPALFMLSGAMAQHIGSFAFSFVGIAMLGFVALMFLGMVSMIFGIMHNTLVLTATPDRVRGRIVGLQILAMGMFPLGSLAVGELGDAIGLQETVRVFSGLGFAALVVLALVMPELRGRVKPLDGTGVSPTGEPVTPSA